MRTAARSAEAAGSHAWRMRSRSMASQVAFSSEKARCGSSSSVWYAPSLTYSLSVRLRPRSRMDCPAQMFWAYGVMRGREGGLNSRLATAVLAGT